MESNNAILFTFGLIFLASGIILPFVQHELAQPETSYTGQAIDDAIEGDVTNVNVITVLVSIAGWVIGANVWLNIIYSMMHLIFYMVIYDKIMAVL